jgi:hypothetical protein
LGICIRNLFFDSGKKEGREREGERVEGEKEEERGREKERKKYGMLDEQFGYAGCVCV